MAETKKAGDSRDRERKEEVLSTYYVPGWCQAFLFLPGSWEPSRLPFIAGFIVPI